MNYRAIIIYEDFTSQWYCNQVIHIKLIEGLSIINELKIYKYMNYSEIQ